LMIETSGEVEKGYVIELNPTAQLGGILFPIQGQPRDVPSAIIDYIITETEKTDKNVQMYFNYHKALLPLKKGVAITTKMANLIPNTMTCKKLLIEGEFSRINSLTAIKNQAIRLNINGYVNLQDDKVIEIIALCNDKSFQQLKSVILEFENELQVTDMKEKDWHEPVMLGFYIQDSDNELRNEIQQKGEELVYNNQRIRKLEKEFENIELCNDKSFQQLKSVILEFENELQVTDMKEKDWHEPVMLGFYIQDSDNELRNEIQQKGEELVYNNQRIRKLEKEFENI